MNSVHADRGVSSCTASLPVKAHAENAQLSPSWQSQPTFLDCWMARKPDIPKKSQRRPAVAAQTRRVAATRNRLLVRVCRRQPQLLQQPPHVFAIQTGTGIDTVPRQ